LPIFGVLEAVAMWATRSGHRRINGTQRLGLLVQKVCCRPQIGKLLGAELGQLGKQIFELRSAHAKFSSGNPENSTKPILFANSTRKAPMAMFLL
jgi:hypothetical protein